MILDQAPQTDDIAREGLGAKDRFVGMQLGFQGTMIIVLDPSRVFLGGPGFFGGNGMILEDLVARYDALGGINAGGFIDEDGAGSGGFPEGLTVLEGEAYLWADSGASAAFDMVPVCAMATSWRSCSSSTFFSILCMPRILTALLGIVLLGFQSVICIANTERRNGERVGSAMRTWLITGASSRWAFG